MIRQDQEERVADIRLGDVLEITKDFLPVPRLAGGGYDVHRSPPPDIRVQPRAARGSFSFYSVQNSIKRIGE